MGTSPAARCERQIGRYQIYGELGSGGMATVHYGRLVGDAGFARTVAIKRLHPHCAKLPEFVTMFLDEARLAARIQHPNVVATVDTVVENDDLLLVMEYVPGESVAGLVSACARQGETIPLSIAIRIAADALYGLDAAHHACGPDQEPLRIVHRDVSPQNILVGVDGMARLLDFGIAKASISIHTTREGHLKGKLRYMAPEQVLDEPVTARADVYALSVVLWEMLTAKRLFAASNDAATLAKVLESVVESPSRLSPQVPQEVSAIVLRGLARDPTRRFGSAREMAEALESAGSPALAREVSEWVRRVASEVIGRRLAYVSAIERDVVSSDARASSSVPAVPAADPPGVVMGVVTPNVPALPRAFSSAEQLPTLTDVAPQALPRASPGNLAAVPAVPLPRLRARRWAMAIALALVVTATMATVLVVRAPVTAPALRPVSDVPPTSTSTSTSASAPTSASAEAVAAPPPSSSQAPASTLTLKRETHSSPRRTSGGAGRSCVLPYYVDGTGIRRIKDGCL